MEEGGKIKFGSGGKIPSASTGNTDDAMINLLTEVKEVVLQFGSVLLQPLSQCFENVNLNVVSCVITVLAKLTIRCTYEAYAERKSTNLFKN